MGPVCLSRHADSGTPGHNPADLGEQPFGWG